MHIYYGDDQSLSLTATSQSYFISYTISKIVIVRSYVANWYGCKELGFHLLHHHRLFIRPSGTVIFLLWVCKYAVYNCIHQPPAMFLRSWDHLLICVKNLGFVNKITNRLSKLLPYNKPLQRFKAFSDWHGHFNVSQCLKTACRRQRHGDTNRDTSEFASRELS